VWHNAKRCVHGPLPLAQNGKLRGTQRGCAPAFFTSPSFQSAVLSGLPERREACERLIEGDAINLEREPKNPHDSNAILVLSDDDCELGYVPREEALAIAPLMDAGADATGTVRRVRETPDGKAVPILQIKVRRGDVDPSVVQPVAPCRAPVGDVIASHLRRRPKRQGQDADVCRR